MLTFEHVSSSWGSAYGWERQDKLSSATLVDLRFHYFLGDVRISDDHGVVLDTKIGSVGILDFAISMLAIAEQMTTRQDAASEYRFKESNDWISVLKVGDDVFLACSYAPGIAQASFGEFTDQAGRFLATTLDQLSSDFPALALNREVASIRKKLP